MIAIESTPIKLNGGTSHQERQDSSRKSCGDREARHTLIANLRHELRNLLNAIIGLSDILLEDMNEAKGDDPAPDIFADLFYVNQTGKQILAVISDILDPGKIEQDQCKADFHGTWDALHDRLRPTLRNLLSRAEILLAIAREAQLQSLIDDMNIICSSAKKLNTVIEHLAFPPGFSGMQSVEPDTNPNGADTVHEIVGVIGSMNSFSPQRKEQRSFILVVDDDKTNRDLLCRWLNREEHTIIAAENGCEAIDLLARHDFDLVLLDIIMPEIDGYQVLRHMRSTGRLQDVPVIIISAFDEADSAVRCIEAGAEEYLTKPFDKNMLKARVKACLQNRIERNKRVRELNAHLDSKAHQLQMTEEELGASRHEVEVLEEKTARIQSAVRQEIEKTRRISILDILVIVGCGLILGLVFNAANPGAVKLIPTSWSAEAPVFSDIDSAKAKLDTKSALFVDARPSEYFKRGHIPGAVSLPNTLFDFIYAMKLAELGPETEIIVYGRDISRLHDEEAASRLRARGHRNISIMVDGLPAWQKRGYPLEK